jgi:aldehyde dehydrogenase (NAD(P)+)
MEVGTGPLPLAELNRGITVLKERADQWARLGFAGKIRHLHAMRGRTIDVAREWVETASRAKGINGTPLVGEEWLCGPYAMLTAIDALIATLGRLAIGRDPLPPRRVRTRRDGQVVVEVFPNQLGDRIVLNGVHADVWMEPSVTRANLRDSIASFYRQTNPRGFLTLVLGAGNVSSIPPLDVLTTLYARGSVALLKLNPVNAYLSPIFARVFSSLIEEGFVRVTDGGADVGAYLCAHPATDAIHMTGAQRTHDAIVFGAGPEGAERKRAGTPIIEKRVTSELGNVTPVIVVPGPWSKADLAFQAAHVATMKMHNAGANCIAAQVVVTPEDWDFTSSFIERVEDALRNAPARPSYYPGELERARFVAQTHPGARAFTRRDDDERVFVPELDPNQPEQLLFEYEMFCPALAHTSLPGDDAATFLRNAVAFCNDRLYGSLAVTMLIHPRTQAALGDALDDAIADLRYGNVGVNAWPGVGYTLPTVSWGAFPGNDITDAGSGIGVVHNAFLFDRPQKGVVYAPFAPFPRSLRNGERTLLPTPPWFVTHRRADKVGRRIFAFAAKPSLFRLARTAFAAMRP